jgi:hypothetical protein
MKKIFAILTKASKMKNILIYVYRGLVVGKAAFVAGFEALKVERPEDKAYAKLENIPEYLDAAAKAVKTILTWIGVDDREIQDFVDRDFNAEDGKALAEITTALKNN